MFNTKKFLQAVGLSILITIVTAFLLGFLPVIPYGVYMAILVVATYGSMGYFAARWNVDTPYTAAFIGAILISFMNLLVSDLIFNVAVFLDPDGIGRSLSLAVVVSLLFAVVTVFIRSKEKVHPIDS